MKKRTQGFTAVEAVIILVVVGVVGALGYIGYQHLTGTATSTPVARQDTSSQPAQPGTAASIDSLTAQDIQSEAAIDSTHSADDQTQAQAATDAADKLQGAYDESSF